MLFRWIHLSDLHFAYKDYHTNRLRLKLLNRLEEVNRQNEIHALFITGDITDKNAEYDNDLYSFINEIVGVLRLTREQLFMVPGNHDIARSSARDNNLIKLREKGFDGICKMDNTAIWYFLNAQQEFNNLYLRLKGQTFLCDQVHSVTKGTGINIVNMNTAWLCGEDDEEGQLFIGSHLLFESLNQANLSPSDINIAIGHHNITNFHRSEQEQLRGLFKDYNIDFYLSGHSHTSSIHYDYHIDTHFGICRQARSDTFDTGGFILGNLDIESGNHFVQYHTWKQPGYWAYDNDVGVEAPNGYYRINSAKFPYIRTGKSTLIIHKAMGAPANQNNIIKELGLKANIFQYPYSAIEIDDKDQWIEHKNNTKAFVDSFLKDMEYAHVVPLSQIPLLVYMGYLFQNNSDMSIYQLNENQQWVLDSDEAEEVSVSSKIFENNSERKRLIIKVEVSGHINNVDLDAHVETTKDSIIEIAIDKPQRYKVLYRSQVKSIKNEFRRVSEMYLANYEEIHLFCAVPAGLAVEIGRCILNSTWPKVYLYNYRRNSEPKYQMAFDIN